MAVKQVSCYDFLAVSAKFRLILRLIRINEVIFFHWFTVANKEDRSDVVLLKNTNMPKEMQEDAINFARQALENSNNKKARSY